ncbi:hypothetical protein V3C99_008274, partial [Haemonchus contortus]
HTSFPFLVMFLFLEASSFEIKRLREFVGISLNFLPAFLFLSFSFFWKIPSIL